MEEYRRLPKFEQFTAPKVGMAAETIEDAIASRLTGERFVVAIADGATQAFAASRWAHLLAKHFVARPQISRISQAWLNSVKDEYRSQIDFAALPWHALEKASRGSFSTLLGLVVDRAECRYRAIAVGDSCLVVVNRCGALPSISFFPPHLADVGGFTNSPYLVASNPNFNARLPQMQYTMRTWRHVPERAIFLFMTDALADWFARAHRCGEEPWRRLADLHSHKEFDHVVATLREAGKLRDDDTTLIVMEVAGDA